MDNLDTRLEGCFRVIFPELDKQQIRHATNTSVAAWDSVATVTLINVIEEEFATQIDVEDAGKLVSFEQFLAYMKARPDGLS